MWNKIEIFTNVKSNIKTNYTINRKWEQWDGPHILFLIIGCDRGYMEKLISQPVEMLIYVKKHS